MAAAGVKNALCVNQEVGNAGARRCAARASPTRMTKAGGKVEVLAVDLADPTDAQQRIQARAAGRSRRSTAS